MMDMRNFTFMAWGLTMAWIVAILYVVTIALRERKLRSELDRVKHMIEDRDKK